MIKTTKTLFIVGLIAVIIGLALTYGFFLVIKQKVEATASKETELAGRESLEAQNRSLKLLLADVKPDIEKLSTRIIGPEGVVSFIEEIESLGKEIRVTTKIESVAIEPNEKLKETHELLKLTVLTQGNWHSVFQFLTMMETLPYKTIIDGVTFNRRSGGEEGAAGGSVWNGSMTLRVLKQK